MRETMERIYKTMPLDAIPWNVETPPGILVELVEGGKVPPCRAIDLGCGAGNYAIYLARKGFDVTGVDIAPSAIAQARENAERAGVSCRFLEADVLGDLQEVQETFDFAYDWELLHHIFPDKRKRYVRNVHRLLNPKADYLSVCFHENDPQFGGAGKYRKTQIGTVLYFSSEEELKKLFSPYFTIQELKSVSISGKYAPHIAVYAWMKKR